ncbi:universal stress protein [Erythrobacter sp. HL-111]|uniref:universal stress protein n=1 Tax=Erythrobacter sp. HL-111 TaxID=1798193 RepID=UPI0006D9EFFD|nr:universal stress protein [Erythrobacter sp. HL-111]KPP88117.1 MAG: universal stress protein UspA [Erythrobacteraceae bacterium HL-111]SDT09857.1 Universal stress protein family protein [Erythrobacter sp. HL-111]
MYAHVLVAIDLEDEAGSAVVMGRAAALSQEAGARLTLVHVRPDLPVSYARALPETWDLQQQQAAERELEGLAAAAGCGERVAGVFAPAGSVAREVGALARRLGVDAILVGAHRMDLGRMVLGTQTGAIVRDAPCDVVVVRAEPPRG